MSAQPYEANIRFYCDDLLPNLQHTLAALADIETRYESSAITWRGGQARAR